MRTLLLTLAAIVVMISPAQLRSQITLPSPLDGLDLDSLRGSVRRIIATGYSVDRNDSPPEQQELESSTTVLFDRKGRPLSTTSAVVSYDTLRTQFTWNDSIVTLRSHDASPDLSRHSVFRYYDGRLLSFLSFHTDGATIVDTTDHRTFEYDGDGRLVGCSVRIGRELHYYRQSYDTNGHVVSVRRSSDRSSTVATFRNDSLGRIVESVSRIDGTRAHRIVYEHDTKGRVTEARGYDSTDEGWTQWYVQQWRYDARGNLTLSYDDRAIQYSARYEYTYDKRGNWTTRKTYRGRLVDGHALYVLSEVSRRSIEYWR